MSAVKASGISYYITLTPHEFMLITKGLIGALEPEPVERVISGQKVLVDEEEDAQALGFRLLEQRQKTYQAKMREAERAIENARLAVIPDDA